MDTRCNASNKTKSNKYINNSTSTARNSQDLEGRNQNIDILKNKNTHGIVATASDKTWVPTMVDT